MKKIVLVLMLAWFLFPEPTPAQETGPLMMSVEVGYTLGGMLGGIALGGIVWLTDPGGPTPLQENAKDGAVLGSFVGAIAGYFLLFNSARDPNAPYQPADDFEDLLGAISLSYAPPAPQFGLSSQKQNPQGISLTLLHLKF